MGEYKALKLYFDGELAHRLSGLIKPLYPDFPSESFISGVESRIGPLELKARVRVIAEQLRQALPPSYPDALAVLLGILGPENDTEQGMFNNGYFLMPVAYFVEAYGLQHFELSMNALYEITKRHTSEYAIRPYIERYTDDGLNVLKQWTSDPNAHVRRLVSEGTRPRLPWAKRIGLIRGDIATHFALLEPLLDDDSLYVRKSVANHLNDLTKVDKQVTLDWISHRVQMGAANPWIVKHALRSAVKTGDEAANRLLNKLNRK